MIFLLPFLNCFLLFMCLIKGQLLSKPYGWLMENVFPKFPQWLIQVLGACTLCTATWMGIIELLIIGASVKHFVLLACYNAIATAILFNMLVSRR